MHIGFDAKRYFHNTTGLGNYARTTVRGLLEQYPKHRYSLYTARACAKNSTFPAHPALTVQKACPLGRMVPTLWRSLMIPKFASRHGLDIYHGLSHEIPLTPFPPKVRTVVTMHDLLFVTHPKLYPWIDRHLYVQKYRASCRRADLVLAISENTAADLQDVFRLDPRRIRVVYQSCDPAFWTRASTTNKEHLRRKYALPCEFILFVGSLIARKGCQTLIAALASLPPEERPALAVVGSGPLEKNLRQQTEAAGIATEVRFLGHVPFQDLPALYQAATIFAYPSAAEGFGIPIVEALSSQTPVITSTGSCFAEPGGDAALYVPPGDTDALAHALRTVLASADIRRDMIERGLRHATRFQLSRTSFDLMQVYNELHP